MRRKGTTMPHATRTPPERLSSQRPDAPAAPASHRSAGWLTRRRTAALGLVVATALVFYLCWRIAQPFVPALAWALALAIVGRGLHRWLQRHLRHRGASAAVATGVLILFIAAPVLATAPMLGTKLKEGLDAMRSTPVQERVQKAVKGNPSLAPLAQILQEHAPSADQVAEQLTPRLSRLAASSVWAGVELLVAFFALFYLLRDRDLALDWLRSLLPLSRRETERVFRRVADVVRASVLGTLVVAAVQGLLGGLMFWWLGLPAPLLWGVVMFVLSILPVLGAAIVWLPAAAFLAMEGSWDKALILAGWGTVVIALIDNLLYPLFVGNQLRLHTLLVFIAILGGLMLFGTAGLILGPMALALALAVIDIWRERTAHGHAADAPPQEPPP